MKPAPFRLVTASSAEHALEVLADCRDRGIHAQLLAGGQSLVPQLNLRRERPGVLVDINRLDELDYQRVADGRLHLGALSRHRQLELDPVVAAACPVVPEAVAHIANPAIRNRGTLGGSLAFRAPHSELCTIALATDTTVLTRSLGGGEERLSAVDFLSLPLGGDDAFLVTGTETPAHLVDTGYRFLEVSRRPGDPAMAAVAVRVTLTPEGALSDARVAVASLGPRPQRSDAAERLLDGARPGEEVFAAAARAVAEEVTPVDSLHASADFRRHLARVLTVRALTGATATVRERAA